MNNGSYHCGKVFGLTNSMLVFLNICLNYQKQSIQKDRGWLFFQLGLMKISGCHDPGRQVPAAGFFIFSYR
ncbi:hypothetical protein A4D02_27450 [Niastella koreensis]|uniref:Uncharacterized protein n=1 Tax=Niastella koreensis TaxID=354356 RepID=A0ABX3P2X6_9BACT|nr:hypothetical protein A4D02_27450 [Niastella koreensis]